MNLSLKNGLTLNVYKCILSIQDSRDNNNLLPALHFYIFVLNVLFCSKAWEGKTLEYFYLKKII